MYDLLRRNPDWRPDVGEWVGLINNRNAATARLVVGEIHEGPAGKLSVNTISIDRMAQEHMQDPNPDPEAVMKYANTNRGPAACPIEAIEPYPHPLSGDRWVWDSTEVNDLLHRLVEDGLLVRESPFMLRWTGENPIGGSENRKIRV
jgi:hypothetical protein